MHVHLDAERLVVGSFVLLVALTGVGFGFTAANHVTYLQRGEITGDVTAYSVADGDRRAVRVTVRVENPTVRPVTVTRPTGFEAFLAGQRVAEGGTPTYDPVTVPARGSVTRTVLLYPTDEGDQRWAAVRGAVRDGTLTVAGRFEGRLADERITVAVPEGAADGD